MLGRCDAAAEPAVEPGGLIPEWEIGDPCPLEPPAALRPLSSGLLPSRLEVRLSRVRRASIGPAEKDAAAPPLLESAAFSAASLAPEASSSADDATATPAADEADADVDVPATPMAAEIAASEATFRGDMPTSAARCGMGGGGRDPSRDGDCPGPGLGPAASPGAPGEELNADAGFVTVGGSGGGGDGSKLRRGPSLLFKAGGDAFTSASAPVPERGRARAEEAAGEPEDEAEAARTGGGGGGITGPPDLRKPPSELKPADIPSESNDVVGNAAAGRKRLTGAGGGGGGADGSAYAVNEVVVDAAPPPSPASAGGSAGGGCGALEMGLWGAPGETVPTALPPSPPSEPERWGRAAPALSFEGGAVRPACTAPKPLRSELMTK